MNGKATELGNNIMDLIEKYPSLDTLTIIGVLEVIKTNLIDEELEEEGE